MKPGLTLAPGRCVVAQMPRASCAACAEACPHGALTALPGGISLSPGRCSGCGHCVAACPQDALSLPQLPAAVEAEAEGVAHVSCPRAPDPPEGARLCAQALSLRELARLWLGGTRILALRIGDCSGCPEAPGAEAGLTSRLAHLNALLAARELAPLEARLVPARARAAPRRGLSPPDRGRRALLGLAGGLSRRPDAAAALRGMQLLPAPAGARPCFAWAPGIVAERCSGCDACIRICPEGALIRVKDSTGEMRYTSAPAGCTGCGLCRDICDEDAVELRKTSETLPDVALFPYTCRSCRAEAHHPSAAFAAEALCPACRISGHHRKTVLVLP